MTTFFRHIRWHVPLTLFNNILLARRSIAPNTQTLTNTAVSKARTRSRCSRFVMEGHLEIRGFSLRTSLPWKLRYCTHICIPGRTPGCVCNIFPVLLYRSTSMLFQTIVHAPRRLNGTTRVQIQVLEAAIAPYSIGSHRMPIGKSRPGGYRYSVMLSDTIVCALERGVQSFSNIQ